LKSSVLCCEYQHVKRKEEKKLTGRLMMWCEAGSGEPNALHAEQHRLREKRRTSLSTRLGR
jgi:hypothetical protein